MSMLSTLGLTRSPASDVSPAVHARSQKPRKPCGGSGPTAREFYIGLAVLTVCAGIAMTRGGPEYGFASSKDQDRNTSHAAPAAYPATAPAVINQQHTDDETTQAEKRMTLQQAVSRASQ